MCRSSVDGEIFREKKTLNLKQVLEIARVHESAQRQVKDMSRNGEQSSADVVCKVRGDNQRQKAESQTPQKSGRKCYRCGRVVHFAQPQVKHAVNARKKDTLLFVAGQMLNLFHMMMMMSMLMIRV
jgi:formamidopyrimidine-DNA glycosylase